MKLSEFSVGDVIRNDDTRSLAYECWRGEFVVDEIGGEKFVVDRSGVVRREFDSPYDFTLVRSATSEPQNTITLNGKTYILTTYSEPDMIFIINGHKYAAEEVK